MHNKIVTIYSNVTEFQISFQKIITVYFILFLNIVFLQDFNRAIYSNFKINIIFILHSSICLWTFTGTHSIHSFNISLIDMWNIHLRIHWLWKYCLDYEQTKHTFYVCYHILHDIALCTLMFGLCLRTLIKSYFMILNLLDV